MNDSKPILVADGGTTIIDKEWAAIQDEEIAEKADTEGRVREKLQEQAEDPDDYEIVALPKAHGSIWI